MKRAKAAPPVPHGDAQVTVKLPAAVVRAMKIRGAERGETLRTTVLRALVADGYEVPPEEIGDRRMDAYKRRG